MVDTLRVMSEALITTALLLLPVALVVDGILLAIALGAALLSSWRERSCERSTERAIRRDFLRGADARRGGITILPHGERVVPRYPKEWP